MKIHHNDLYWPYILIRSRSCFDWVIKSITSVLQQDFQDFTILFVDDASDYTREQKCVIRMLLKEHVVIFNDVRRNSLHNAYSVLHQFTGANGIVINVDGDDYLRGRSAVGRIRHAYQSHLDWGVLYGDCLVIDYQHFSSWKNVLPARLRFSGLNVRYPRKVEESGSFRDDYFRPLHPMTWKVSLFQQIKKESLINPHTETWFTTCQDQAIMYPLLEMVGKNYGVLKWPTYVYRMNHLQSDFVLQKKLQLEEEKIITHQLKRYHRVV